LNQEENLSRNTPRKQRTSMCSKDTRHKTQDTRYNIQLINNQGSRNKIQTITNNQTSNRKKFEY